MHSVRVKSGSAIERIVRAVYESDNTSTDANTALQPAEDLSPVGSNALEGPLNKLKNIDLHLF